MSANNLGSKVITAFLEALKAAWKFKAFNSKTARLLCEIAKPTISYWLLLVFEVLPPPTVEKLEFEVGVDSVFYY